MVKGPLRTVLWMLGGLGMIWLVLWLLGLSAMGGMMGEDGMMGGGMPGGGMMDGGMTAMMGAMLVQTFGMLGLAGIFVYLVVDTLRGRGRGGRPGPGEEFER